MAAGKEAVDCSYSRHKKTSRLQENLSAAYAELAPADMDRLNEMLSGVEIHGARYSAAQESMTNR